MIRKLTDYNARKNKFYKTRHDANEWAEWSLQKQNPDDIIFREMLTAEKGKKDCNYACATYYCQASDLTEEDIDALLFINSGLYTYDGWDEDTQAFVIDLLLMGKKNVYENLRYAIDNKLFNDAFTEKMESVCDKAIDKSLATMKARREDISSATYQMIMAFSELAELRKKGKDNPSARKHIDNSVKALNEAVTRFETEIPKFDKSKVLLNDRLDWGALLDKGNLSEEYIERREPLWRYLKK